MSVIKEHWHALLFIHVLHTALHQVSSNW